MNTRLQVEHPVTEMVTGLDLVAPPVPGGQRSAAALFPGRRRACTGHAIEARDQRRGPLRRQVHPYARADHTPARRRRAVGADRRRLRGRATPSTSTTTTLWPRWWPGDRTGRAPGSGSCVRSPRPRSTASPPRSRLTWPCWRTPTSFRCRTRPRGWLPVVDLSSIAPAPMSPRRPQARSARTSRSRCSGRHYDVSVWVPAPPSSCRRRTAQAALEAVAADGGYVAGEAGRGGNRGRPGHQYGQVTVPMQGTIVKVLVKRGDMVEAGQTVCVLEAMKMENNIVSAFAGDGRRGAGGGGPVRRQRRRHRRDQRRSPVQPRPTRANRRGPAALARVRAASRGRRRAPARSGSGRRWQGTAPRTRPRPVTLSSLRPPDASTSAPHWRGRRTASAVSSRDRLSTRTRSAPASRASSSSARSSTSTSRPEARPVARSPPGPGAGPPRQRASTPPRAAMWLSFTKRASERLIRWLAPPRSERRTSPPPVSPGSVLRVSLMTAPVPATAVDDGGGQGGHPGEVGDDVEEGALGRQQRVGRAGQLAEDRHRRRPGRRRARTAWPWPGRSRAGGSPRPGRAGRPQARRRCRLAGPRAKPRPASGPTAAPVGSPSGRSSATAPGNQFPGGASRHGRLTLEAQPARGSVADPRAACRPTCSDGTRRHWPTSSSPPGISWATWRTRHSGSGVRVVGPPVRSPGLVARRAPTPPRPARPGPCWPAPQPRRAGFRGASPCRPERGSWHRRLRPAGVAGNAGEGLHCEAERCSVSGPGGWRPSAAVAAATPSSRANGCPGRHRPPAGQDGLRRPPAHAPPLRAASSTPTGWRRAARWKPPRPPPSALPAWCGPRRRSALRPSCSGPSAKPGPSRARGQAGRRQAATNVGKRPPRLSPRSAWRPGSNGRPRAQPSAAPSPG